MKSGPSDCFAAATVPTAPTPPTYCTGLLRPAGIAILKHFSRQTEGYRGMSAHSHAPCDCISRQSEPE
jgi:hypothetical protein